MDKSRKTVFIDIETDGLVEKIDVPGKRSGTTRKEQIPYETMFMDYPNIVSMAWKINDGETTEYILNQQGREIPTEASDIHGITTEIANKSEHFFPKVLSFFLEDAADSEIVVGHGLYFDTSIIKANILKAGLPEGVEKPFFDAATEILHKYKRIDTMRSTAKMMGKWPTLQELHMKIFNKEFDAHTAGSDVDAVAKCYEWLVKEGIVLTFEELQEKAKEKEEKLNNAS